MLPYDYRYTYRYMWLARTWTRIALSYAVLVLLTAGVLAFLLGGEFEAHEEEALRSRLADQARAVAYDSAPLFTQQAPISATNSLAHDLSALFGTRVTLIRPDGLVVGDSEEDPTHMENHATRPEIAQVLVDSLPASGGSTTGSVVGSSSRLSATVHRRLLYVAVAVKAHNDPAHLVGVARVAYPMTSVEQARNVLWGSLALAVLLVSLPAALLGVLLARSIVGPLTALRGTAHRFGKGDLSARASSSGGEIGELGREFNMMAERLSDTIRRRTFERNQMAAVLSQMHDGILITNEHGYIESLNAAAALLFGTTTDKAEGHSLIEVTHSHELHQAMSIVLSQAGERQRLQVETGGRKLAAVVTAVPMPTDTGSYASPGQEGDNSAGLVVVQDVTELHRLERARREFVSNISHELRTPLASAKLLVETVSAVLTEDPEAAQGFLQRINVELDGLTQLVRELLELSRIESGQAAPSLEPSSVSTLLEQAARRLAPQAERAGVALKIDIQLGAEEAFLLVEADPRQIEQVLINLIHNAIKFTEPGGSISLGAALGERDVVISVTDTGAGIPREDLPRIFERFYKVDKARTSENIRDGGTGLGLSICKHIVQAHGGEIWVESVFGQGATFFFTLPKLPPRLSDGSLIYAGTD